MFNENQNKIRFLDDLTDLQIRAKHLESKSQKGFSSDNDDIEFEMEDLRNSCLETSGIFYEETDDEFAKNMAEKFRKPMSFNPKEIVLVIKDIAADIAELYARAFKLMLENASSMKLKTAELSSEGYAPARSLEADKTFENQESKSKETNKKARQSQEVEKAEDLFKSTAKNDKSAQKSEMSAGQKEIKRSSNIVFVRNKTAVQQKAPAPSMSREKAPAMTAPQMSM